jgi:hypothetical protein
MKRIIEADVPAWVIGLYLQFPKLRDGVQKIEFYSRCGLERKRNKTPNERKDIDVSRKSRIGTIGVIYAKI